MISDSCLTPCLLDVNSVKYWLSTFFPASSGGPKSSKLLHLDYQGAARFHQEIFVLEHNGLWRRYQAEHHDPEPNSENT
ncbi:hypothetical protein NL676_020032 [Syzygium grande]|nr:hypothetical protein NL676_020032 [Syzygium grande]